jgi:hypothetical protein
MPTVAKQRKAELIDDEGRKTERIYKRAQQR